MLVRIHGGKVYDPRNNINGKKVDLFFRNGRMVKAPANLESVDETIDATGCAIMAGGIDIQLLGIGRNGHIGFNEPFSVPNSRTRLAVLDPITRRDASSAFFSEENVPLQAITMGLATIMEAQRILLVAAQCLNEKFQILFHEKFERPFSFWKKECKYEFFYRYVFGKFG